MVLFVFRSRRKKKDYMYSCDDDGKKILFAVFLGTLGVFGILFLLLLFLKKFLSSSRLFTSLSMYSGKRCQCVCFNRALEYYKNQRPLNKEMLAKIHEKPNRREILFLGFRNLKEC